jgi:uncharacterized protein
MPRVLTVVALALTAVLTACTGAPAGPNWLPPAEEREANWQAWTASKDSLFLTDESPLLPEHRAAFTALPYFPYDSTLAFPVALEPLLGADTLRMTTTTGQIRRYVRYGSFPFSHRGRAHRLTVFRAVDGGEEHLFVPFWDGTNRNGTYDGGRYIDLRPRPDGRYVLDFNYAYSPYCAYDPAYSCPVPPAENRLALQVRAGERYPFAAL